MISTTLTSLWWALFGEKYELKRVSDTSAS